MIEKKFAYIESYGCAANQNNGEIIKGLLVSNGIEITQNVKIADFIIINTCIVKGPTEKRMERRIQELLKEKKPVIVSGCMPNVRAEKLMKLENVYLLGTNHVKNIVNLLRDLENKKYNVSKYLETKKEIKLCVPKIRKSKIIGITQIAEGCIGKCKFCITKLVKRDLFSYPQDMIIKNIKKDLDSGCKEIWITSQDNAAYGLDNGKRELPHLLKKIIAIDKKFWLRVGMMNPNNLIPILDDMIEIYKNEKMFKFLHIPIQSGSDKVLKEMNRFYSCKDFLNIVKKFRKNIPNITISTDIIVGYPTETEKDFEKTLSLIKEARPDVINVSRYWPMKGTVAAEMEQLSHDVIKRRIKKLIKLYRNILKQKNKKWLSWKGKCLIDEYKNENYIARNIFYKPIVIITDKSSKNNLLGKFVNVEIIKTFPNFLVGKIVKYN